MAKQDAKQQVAVRLPLRQKAELEREAAERGVSRSEYIRSILNDRHRAGEVERLEKRLAIREGRIDQLEEQLARRSQLEDKVDVLATRVDESHSVDPPFPIRWWQWFRSRSNTGSSEEGSE